MVFLKLFSLLTLILALTLNAIKIVLHELAAYHATAHHFLNTFPGK